MDARDCSFSARLDCRYLVRLPETIDDRTALVVALHGFGQSAEIMLPLAEKAFGERHVIAAIEGPYQFFLNGATSDVGYCWVTSRRSAASIRLHHEMVGHVLNEVGREYGIPAARSILAGFSQPVSLNYRFAAACPKAIRGVAGICGGIPSDWLASASHVDPAALHIARREDVFYPPAVTEQYAERLRTRVEDVEFHLLDGGHRFPSQARPIVEGWLERILR
jgi:predicted esterase